MAGGVALNCVANGRIVREGPFENLWVQPAAGDAGGALGAALFAYNAVLGKPRALRMDHCYWGPQYSDEAIRKYLDARGAPYRTLPRDEMIRETARLLAEEQAVVGWFQGRMEWGPRSLGSRSILADARNRENWKRVNLKIKFRESFRPFAPACLAEKAQDWFEIDRESPYMLLVCPVKGLQTYAAETSEGPVTRFTSALPAITHVDGSARVQTVTRAQHAEFYDLLAEFDRQTGCPVLINTSFNVRGEPIVCTPHDAYLCFMRTEHGRARARQPDPAQAGAARVPRGRGLARALRARLNAQTAGPADANQETNEWRRRSRAACRSSASCGPS